MLAEVPAEKKNFFPLLFFHDNFSPFLTLQVFAFPPLNFPALIALFVNLFYKKARKLNWGLNGISFFLFIPCFSRTFAQRLRSSRKPGSDHPAGMKD